MTESREPYIAGRKKVYTVRIASELPVKEFINHLQQRLIKSEMEFEGVIEIAYEEGKR
jgi:hypothetical protein